MSSESGVSKLNLKEYICEWGYEDRSGTLAGNRIVIRGEQPGANEGPVGSLFRDSSVIYI